MLLLPRARGERKGSWALCSGCPVRKECFETALSQGEGFGIGGARRKTAQSLETEAPSWAPRRVQLCEAGSAQLSWLEVSAITARISPRPSERDPWYHV